MAEISRRAGVGMATLYRNFPTRWGYDNEGSSPAPSSDTYRGPAPASEPETQALDGLFAALTPEFLVNYHSAAELLLYGIGTIIGPSLGGPVMTWAGPYALFMVTAVAHILISAYAIIRSRQRAPVPVEERGTYQTAPAPTSQMATPESLSLNPRAQPLPEGDDAGSVAPREKGVEPA